MKTEDLFKRVFYVIVILNELMMISWINVPLMVNPLSKLQCNLTILMNKLFGKTFTLKSSTEVSSNKPQTAKPAQFIRMSTGPMVSQAYRMVQ